MHRIDGAGHVSNMFVGPDFATNRAPTEFTADWFNAIQEEIVGIVLAAGLTLNKAQNNQLLQALYKLQGNNAEVLVVTGNTTLTAADAGKLIVGGSATPFTVTLPLTNTMRDGAKFEIVNMNAGDMTISRQGTTDIINTSSTRLSEVLGTGDSLVLHAKPSLGMFYASGGSNQITYAAKFAVSRNPSGYQRLPSGLIIQWGAFTASASPGGGVAVIFPIAFPTACLRLTLTGTNNATTTTSAWHNSDQSTAGFTGHSNIANNSVEYIAIGH